MNNPTPMDDNELAYAALSLFGNNVSGAKPEWHEIEAWQQNTLPVQRAAEVLSHVANDAECFQQWLDICEAAEWVAQEKLSTSAERTIESASTPDSLKDRAKKWFASLFDQPLPVYAAGFAAIFLAVLVVPLLQQGGNLQQRLDDSYELYMAAPPAGEISAPLPRKTRSLGNLLDKITPAGIEQHYFSQGLTEGLARLQSTPGADWIAWLEALPAEALDCTKAADQNQCLQAAKDFIAVGQWTVMVYSACQGSLQGNLSENTENREFWQQQYALHADLQQLPAMRDSVLLRPAMASQAGNNKDSVCKSVGLLLNTLQ